MTRQQQFKDYIKRWELTTGNVLKVEELYSLVEAAYSDGLTGGREEMRLEIMSAVEELRSK